MFSLVSLFSGAIKLVNWLAERLERRELIDQGVRQHIGEANAIALANTKKAMAARAAVPKYLAGGGMPDDDPYRRD